MWQRWMEKDETREDGDDDNLIETQRENLGGKLALRLQNKWIHEYCYATISAKVKPELKIVSPAGSVENIIIIMAMLEM